MGIITETCQRENAKLIHLAHAHFDTYSDWPWHVWLLPSKPQKAGNGQEDEAGLDKGRIIDQYVNVT